MTALTLYDHEIRRLLSAGSVLVLRPVKPQPPDGVTRVFTWYAPELSADLKAQEGCYYWMLYPEPDDWLNSIHFHAACPLGAPGSVAWVRETWRIIPHHSDYVLEYAAAPQLQRHSVHPDTADHASMTGKWRSPIYMPRWASRCDVTVQDVRVLRINELLQDDESMAGFTDDIPAYNHIHFQNDWLRRYAHRFPEDLWQLWVWAVTVHKI